MTTRRRKGSLNWRAPGRHRPKAGMPFLRVFVLLLLLVSAGAFACFAVTGQERFKHFGLVVLKWTLVGAFVFFGVLILERIV